MVNSFVVPANIDYRERMVNRKFVLFSKTPLFYAKQALNIDKMLNFDKNEMAFPGAY
jgi:hypothetical protein